MTHESSRRHPGYLQREPIPWGEVAARVLVWPIVSALIWWLFFPTHPLLSVGCGFVAWLVILWLWDGWRHDVHLRQMKEKADATKTKMQSARLREDNEWPIEF